MRTSPRTLPSQSSPSNCTPSLPSLFVEVESLEATGFKSRAASVKSYIESSFFFTIFVVEQASEQRRHQPSKSGEDKKNFLGPRPFGKRRAFIRFLSINHAKSN